MPAFFNKTNAEVFMQRQRYYYYTNYKQSFAHYNWYLKFLRKAINNVHVNTFTPTSKEMYLFNNTT